MTTTHKIGLGGSCHWCTEAIFQSLMGVIKVEQGWISSTENITFSEAVLVSYNPRYITLHTLVQIHLYTHSCTSNHSMRDKYRSAIYYFSLGQKEQSTQILEDLQSEFNEKLITQVLSFEDFKLNKEEQLNYYYTDPQRPFCTNVIQPKLKSLLNKFSQNINTKKLKQIADYETPKA